MSDNVIAAVSYMGKHFGFPFNMWHGHDYYYFTKDPAEAKILLHNLSAQNKGTVYKDVAYVFQNSLLTIHCEYEQLNISNIYNNQLVLIFFWEFCI